MGLCVQLPLQAPRTRNERWESRFVAILDYFSRSEPCRRIGTQPQNSSNHWALPGGGAIDEGDIFIRIGRSLVFSEIESNVLPTGYEFVSKSFQIAVENNFRRHRERRSYRRSTTLIDFPAHYRYSIQYLHPWYKVDKDPYTMDHRSLQIKLREVRGLLESEGRDPKAHGLVERSSAIWILWCDVFTDIINRRLPFSQVRIRPESIILCVKLTRMNCLKLALEGNALRRYESSSFLALLAHMSAPRGSTHLFAPYGECRLAPLPQELSHTQPMNPPVGFKVR